MIFSSQISVVWRRKFGANHTKIEAFIINSDKHSHIWGKFWTLGTLKQNLQLVSFFYHKTYDDRSYFSILIR